MERCGEVFEECIPRGDSLVPPISISAVYRRTSTGLPEREYLEVKYGRENNPSVMVFEETMSCVEAAEYGLAFNSGMAAIAAIAHYARERDLRVLGSRLLYGSTRRLLERILPGEKLFFAGPPWDELLSQVERADMVVVETIGNPTLRVPPLEDLARECRARDCMLVVDNTFASPVSYRPLLHGATVVVESLTKYIGGHNDLLGGYTGTRVEEVHASLWDWRRLLGGTLQPLEAYLAYRGLRTLEIRYKRATQTALFLAERLSALLGEDNVIYPCLPSHPDYERAKKNLNGLCGGVLSLDLGSAKAAQAFLESLEIITPAPSLGSVDSLASHPYTSSHRGMPEKEKEELGITPGLVRISVGLEDPRILWRDIERAVSRARSQLK